MSSITRTDFLDLARRIATGRETRADFALMNRLVASFNACDGLGTRDLMETADPSRGQWNLRALLDLVSSEVEGVGNRGRMMQLKKAEGET